MTPLEKREQLIRMFGAYSKRLEEIYDDYINRLARIGLSEAVFPMIVDGGALFSFAPESKASLDNIFDDFVGKQMGVFRAGIADGVALAYTHDSELLQGFSLFSDKAVSTMRKTAADAFIRGRLKSPRGLSLSNLIWNYAQQAKSEFEVAMSNIISDGLKAGTSAEELGRMVRGELKHPDMMYRRYHEKVLMSDGTKKDVVTWRRKVIDENGKVRFIKAPLEKVGMGHYRSSRKNALRLMRTEINASYHTANYERWLQEPFVIGVRIFLSPQHPDKDECDLLAGNYPKDFYWTGWHPQCYSDDTKVLTNRGWKFFADVTDHDLILSLNPETRETEYVCIAAKQRWWKDGVMIHFSNRSLDCLVTPEHRMVYLSKGDNEIKYCTARDFSCGMGWFFSEDKIIYRFSKEWRVYSGYVYDLTLERNHIMYVQRNGQCFWGSNCMCAIAPITLQGDEKREYYTRVAKGEDMSDYVSPNAITDVPQGYKDYVKDNAQRIVDADKRGKLAWHFEDNRQYWEDIAKLAVENARQSAAQGTPLTLEHLQEKIDETVKQLKADGELRGITDEDLHTLSEELKKVLKDNDFGMRIPRLNKNREDVIDAIFDTYFKNQIETGTGQGMIDVEERKKVSNRLFGTDISKAAPVDFEKYGMLMDRDILKQSKKANGGQYWNYGDGIEVRFKKDRVNATFTLGDSLWTGFVPTPVNEPGITSVNRAFIQPTISAMRKGDFKSLENYNNVCTYIELQYHGKLTLDCIESVYIPQQTLRQLKPGTFDKIKKVGCTIYTTDADGKLITL